MLEKKTTKKTKEIIEPKTIDSFLKALEAEKTAKATKEHFASKIIPALKKAGMKSLLHKGFNITLCKKDTLEFGADIKALAEKLKKQQEHAKLDGKFKVLNTSEYLMTSSKTYAPPERFCTNGVLPFEKKEPTKPKQVKVGKKLA